MRPIRPTVSTELLLFLRLAIAVDTPAFQGSSTRSICSSAVESKSKRRPFIVTFAHGSQMQSAMHTVKLVHQCQAAVPGPVLYATGGRRFHGASSYFLPQQQSLGQYTRACR